MRPPMTTARNEGAQQTGPLHHHHHRKSSLNQKEVLAENQTNRSRPKSAPLQSINLDAGIAEIHLENFAPTSPPAASFHDHSELGGHRNNCNFKLNRFSSDVSDRTVSNYPSNTTCNANRTSSGLSSIYISEISNAIGDNTDRNLFVNALDDSFLLFESDDNSPLNAKNIVVSPSLVTLPLSETEPLLTNIEATVSDPERAICVNKNSASLIFTKKDVQGRKDITPTSYAVVSERSGRNRNNSLDTGRYVVGESRAFNRRSLPFDYAANEDTTSCNFLHIESRANSKSTTAGNNRKQHAYSWYAPVYSALEEELEQDSRDSSPIHNLASKRRPTELPLSDNETVSLLESKNQINIQPQLHQKSRIRRTQTDHPSSLSLTAQSSNLGSGTQGSHQNDSEGPPATSLLAGGPIPRRRRFENFLKSLVGRKPSKETIPANPPTLPSPDITITRSPSNPINFQSAEGGGQRHSVISNNGGFYCSDKPSGSTTSLNVVQQKLWNVVPLLRRDGSAASLNQEKSQSVVQYTGLRKCETVLAISRQLSTCSAGGGGGVDSAGSNVNVRGSMANGVEQIRPLNRLRNSLSTSNATCSRCSSLLSLAASGSRYSLNAANSGFVNVNNNFSNNKNSGNLSASNNRIASSGGGAIVVNAINGECNSRKSSSGANGPPSSNNTTATLHSSTASSASSPTSPLGTETFICKLCLADVTKPNERTTISHCGCSFCTECMKAYVEFEISEGAYEISCPDAECPAQGSMLLTEISNLASSNSLKKYHRYRLNREIELDKYRTWCPRAGCETICQVGSSFATTSSSAEDKENTITQILCAVQCPTCKEEFCSGCKKPWHPNISCDENNRRLAAEGQDDIGIPFDNELIKCCPMCAVPIEKDEGCAQMMCKRCKHVFCWYCLASLDDDFLLRHYDKGPCKNKLGHSRASVVWHRAQVIGIFAGFGILLLVASPLLLLAAPCIICCKCRICSGSGKNTDEPDGDLDEAVALQR